MISRLSIRVYGICVYEGCVLVVKEKIQGAEIWKLPGGGLELGEGITECLRREIKEELAIGVTPAPQPCYVSPGFLESKFFDKTQIILLYHLVPINSFQKQSIVGASEILSWQWYSPADAIEVLSLQSDEEAISTLL